MATRIIFWPLPLLKGFFFFFFFFFNSPHFTESKDEAASSGDESTSDEESDEEIDVTVVSKKKKESPAERKRKIAKKRSAMNHLSSKPTRNRTPAFMSCFISFVRSKHSQFGLVDPQKIHKQLGEVALW